MTDVKAGPNPLYLREDQLHEAMELLFFAYRDFTTECDAILASYGFGRAHHRVVYFVGRNPDISVTALLEILRITKQSLSRVLGRLVREGFVTTRQDPADGRRRLLALTAKGGTWRAACPRPSEPASPRRIAAPVVSPWKDTGRS